jgi:hypothetical protein
MSRYKVRASAEAVEKDFPHFVDIAVPLGGLGTALVRERPQPPHSNLPL